VIDDEPFQIFNMLLLKFSEHGIRLCESDRCWWVLPRLFLFGCVHGRCVVEDFSIETLSTGSICGQGKAKGFQNGEKKEAKLPIAL